MSAEISHLPIWKKIYPGHHKPLTTIKKGVPSVATARLQRWTLLHVLAAYHYDIEFRSTMAHGNADALPRLLLPEETS